MILSLVTLLMKKVIRIVMGDWNLDEIHVNYETKFGASCILPITK